MVERDDPARRLRDQDRDGVRAEVLLADAAVALFALDDANAQAAAFRRCNDELAVFCRTAPERFRGIACIAAYDIAAAVEELHRARELGLAGVAIWQTPDPRFPLQSAHYEPLWAAAAAAGMPVHLHARTGHLTVRDPAPLSATEELRAAVNHAQNETNDALFGMLFSGAFDRYPGLRLVIAEGECGWLPFVLQQWDYIADRVAKKERLPIARKPSEIFAAQVYVTWTNDHAGTRHLSWWGQDNLMWANAAPRARETVAGAIGGLPPEVQVKLVHDNAARLYGLIA
jgi:predicted TIM-barrel fold metal-dependent hydrolase